MKKSFLIVPAVVALILTSVLSRADEATTKPSAARTSEGERRVKTLIVEDAKKVAPSLAQRMVDEFSGENFAPVEYYLHAHLAPLIKKYGEEGFEDYDNELREAVDKEFTRLVEKAIGCPKPTKDGTSTTTYWKVVSTVEDSLKKDSWNGSYQRMSLPMFVAIAHGYKWVWGTTLEYQTISRFGAVMKSSINIYYSKSAGLQTYIDEPSVAEMVLSPRYFEDVDKHEQAQKDKSSNTKGSKEGQ
jgi:hypothetical protein